MRPVPHPLLKRPHPALQTAFALSLSLTALSPLLGAVPETWCDWLRPELRQARAEETNLAERLAALGSPVVGQTVTQFGYLHPRLKALPPSSPWIQVDLGASQPVDTVALIPAQVDWQPLDKGSHGFPVRFRVDVSDDETFGTFSCVAAFVDSDFPDPGIAPVTMRAVGVRGRYVRLTVTKLVQHEGQFFFALGELMILNGNRNIANGATLQASAKVSFPPRWALEYLVDGKTGLGPPIQKNLLPYDGLYSGPLTDGSLPWMTVDLGRIVPIQEIRLHPIHARFGADIPGFSFPAKMRLELSKEASFPESLDLMDQNAPDSPNPGNNPVTINAREHLARFVRITAARNTRFGLSEIEVYSEGLNVALGAAVSAPADPATMSKNWPASQLVDGYTSYGKLMELPEWLALWDQRKSTQDALSQVRLYRTRLSEETQETLQKAGIGLGAFLLCGVALGSVAVSRRARRTQQDAITALRARFAHDLHDELGSNLAAISVLSEIAKKGSSPAQADAWLEIQDIANESNDALHEILWVSGARQEMGRDFVNHLQKVATRMLPERSIRWIPELPEVPKEWSLEGRRQVFLFFKEALSNVVKHSSATQVELSLSVSDGRLKLVIQDNGTGISSESREGTGLTSLQARAKTLGGACQITSKSGEGTAVQLLIPISTDAA